MKKIVLVLAFATLLFAEYGYKGYQGYGNSNSRDDDRIERSYEKPGDNNWNNMQLDKQRYGDKNNYQGSRPGDNDWGERNLKNLMEDK